MATMRLSAQAVDALNRRFRVQNAQDTVDYQFDALGRRSIAWRESINFGIRDSYYWGSTPIAYHAFDGTTYYQQQDWERTERVRTDAQGNTVASYFTLPFGDGFWDSSNSDEVPDHFAGTERDRESNTDHALFRQYQDVLGRWMSPDPYDGSYDLNNPQSLNRYVYALNNPLAYIDPDGTTSDPCAGIENCVYGGPVSSPCPTLGSCGGSAPGGGGIGISPPSGSGGNSGGGNGAPSKPSTLDCASGFAQRTSVAGGLNKLGVGNNGGAGGLLTNALAGNAVSGIVDLFRNGGSLVDVAFGGTRLGIPGATTTLGGGISGVVQDATAAGVHSVISVGGELTTLSGAFSTVGLTGAEYATGFGELKFGYDAIAYAGGLVGCKLGVIP